MIWSALLPKHFLNPPELPFAYPFGFGRGGLALGRDRLFTSAVPLVDHELRGNRSDENAGGNLQGEFH